MTESRRTVLVTAAGIANGNNLILSLRHGGLDVRIVGTNMNAALLAKSTADVSLLLPPASHPQYTEQAARVVEEHGVDVFIATNDKEVERVSRDRAELGCAVLLPPDDVVRLCQDKHELYLRLADRGIPMARSIPLADLADIDAAFEALADTGDRFWVRTRRGAGSLAATWVRTPEQARHWIGLWVEMRGLSVADFTVSEFLPGRDFAFQSVWHEGRLIVAKMVERLEYYWGHTRLSGMSSTPRVAKTIRDDATLEIIFETIRAVMPEPHGNFCMDLKGGRDGTMNITEINIGRFCQITPIFDLTGRINTAEAHVRLALGERPDFGEPIDIEEDRYLLREIDSPPAIVSGEVIRRFRETASWSR
jgi:biotin carboxylase